MVPPSIKRYIPLFSWLVAALTLILIPAKILGSGYLPGDDALRHAAKAVSGKAWSEILVMRSGFEIDPHAGWHVILGAIHRWQGGNAETLVVISCFGLMLLVGVSALPWFRWPEAWLAGLLAGSIFVPLFVTRLMMGRPYLLSMAVFITLLLLWSRVENRRPRTGELLATIVLIAAAAWIHGSFYLFGIPAVGILLAGRWRQSVWFGGCWLVGSFLGASLTGHPVQFLYQWIRLLFEAFGTHAFSRQLVGEFQPSDGDWAMVLAVAAMLLWRSRSPDWKPKDLVDPIFLTGVLGWVLGLKVIRFWWDWGLPAMVLWMALEFQKQCEAYLGRESLRRPLIAAGLAASLLFGTTSDAHSRWTWNLTKQYISPDDPQLAGWLPGDNGVCYAADMFFFYETFFKNPTAPWRYVLGFEPGLMRPEDLDVMHKVQWNLGDVSFYKPWVAKMRPNDRLFIRASWTETSPPRIPELEWRLAPNKVWIGRLRAATNAPPAKQ